jgi:hypothetical protein
MLTLRYIDNLGSERVIGGIVDVAFQHDDENRAYVVATMAQPVENITPPSWTFGPAMAGEGAGSGAPLQIFVMNEAGSTVASYRLFADTRNPQPANEQEAGQAEAA